MPVRRPLLLLLATVACVTPALAQESGGTLDQRVTRVEKELRAVQRKVFPGGEAQFVEPEIGGQPAPPPVAPGNPASSPVADLSARVDAVEQELSRLTAQSEQNGYQVRQLQDAFDKYRAATDARLATLEARGVPAPAPAAAPAGASDSWPPAPAAAPERPAPTPEPEAAPSPAPAAAPSTGDPAHDAYLAGYQLWVDKKYPEAETALGAVVTKYPQNKWASYAQNLRGRAFLDEGRPAEAARALYQNYHDMPRGERAPDSLYYLGQALTQLKKQPEACRVYGELDDVYGPTLKDPLKSRAAQAEKDAGCKK